MSHPETTVFDNGLFNRDQFIVHENSSEIVLLKVGAGLKKLYLEPTARCNLACVTCMRQQWPAVPDGEMDMAVFEQLLKQMKQFPQLEKVHLGGFGEPLAHSQALNMLGMLAGAGYSISFNTNGTLLTEEVAAELIRLGVRAVYFSVDGLDQEMFGKIRVNGDYNAIIENMLTLRRLKQRKKVNYPKIGLEYVLMKSNLDQLPLLPKLAKEVGAPAVLVTNLLAYSEEIIREVLYETPGMDRELGAGGLAAPFRGSLPEGFCFPEPAVWPAVEQDYVLWGSLRLPRMYWGSSRRCGFVEDDSTVGRYDGAVAPCYGLLYSYPYYLDNRRKDVSAHLLGNVSENSLYDIWNSPDYIRFRHRVRNFRFPSCMDCSGAKICDYAEVNEDCWGNAPSCADCLWSQGIVRCP